MVRIYITGFILLLGTIVAKAGENPPKDSVRVAASSKYTRASVFKKFFLGTNYRKVWSTPVSLPVFHMKEQNFKIIELGGGQQTKSLRLEDANGKDWVLRTIDKDVSGAIPKNLRNTFIQRVVQDMVSAAHPYAPLTVPVLANAIGVEVADPVFYYVPYDTAFGEFKELFANTVCMLEEREPTPDGSDTKSTDNYLDDALKGQKKKLDQEAVLRARILDMLIGDWDRHADQWRWAEKKMDGKNSIYAIPRDRDQAYFYSNGFIVSLARLVGGKHFVSYNDDFAGLKNLNRKSWNFDHYFLNELDRSQWEAILKDVQQKLTDQVIHDAITRIPPEVYAISGAELEAKLKGRRDHLVEAGMEYYAFLSEEIKIDGTNQAQNFRITGDDNMLVVAVLNKDGDKLYERRIAEKETRSITISGLGGDDVFVIEPGAMADIRVIMKGNEGNDRYEIKSDISNSVQDKKGSAVKKGKRTRISHK